MTNKYRFFYHFHKQKKCMTVHFKKQCISVNDIICRVPCNTKWNKRQPYLVMQGFCEEVKVSGGVAYII